jgi:hypothetical protein
VQCKFKRNYYLLRNFHFIKIAPADSELSKT